MDRRWPAAVAVACLVLAARPAGAQSSPSGPEFRVNTVTLLGQQGAGVAEDTAGRFVVAWYGQGNEVGYQIWMQRYDAAGLPFGGEALVNTYTLDVKFPPVAVAALAGGGFVVVWSRGSSVLDLDVFGQRYDGGISPVGGEFRVNTYTTGRQSMPAVAADGAGNFVVVWESDGQYGLSSVHAQRFTIAGAPAGAEFRVSGYTSGSQLSPAVARSFIGAFVVAWHGESNPQDPSGVFARRYDPFGAPAGGEFLVNTATTSFQESPAVAADANGNFVIAWQSGEYNANPSVIAQRYSATGPPLGGAFRVNSYTTGTAGRPAVTRRNGDFVIAWDDGSDVFAARYDAAGAALGGPFRVNSYTTNGQSIPAIASRADGGFVVGWTSSGQDGGGDGVYAQKYCLGGDANGDGTVNVADVFYLINYLFAGGPELHGCGDVNGTLTIDVADVFYLINYLFAAGPGPI